MKHNQSKFDLPSFWAEVAHKVYTIFGERVVLTINNEILPEVHQEVCEKLLENSLFGEDFYHRGYLVCEEDIWFSIHVQIHNHEEIEKPLIRVFAILPFIGSKPYVLRLHLEPDRQNQLDVYSPHFFQQYANRAEHYSPQAYAVGRMYKAYKVFENSRRERVEKKCIHPLHFLIGLFVSQNWFFLKTCDSTTFSYEEQLETVDKKWTLVAKDSIIFGITKEEDEVPFTLNVFLTNVDYEMLGPDQKSKLLPMKEELEKRYLSYVMR